MRRFLAPLLAVLAGACASLPATTRVCDCAEMPAAWLTMLQDIRELTEAGRFDAADSVLVAFAAERRGTAEAREVAFWRALYALDPRNPAPQPSTAAQLLDDYLVSDSVYWYRSEARVLRQLAAIQSAGGQPTAAVATTPPTAGRPRADQPVTDKDLEIQQLRERVARLNEELERIRRRLSAPP